MVAVDACTPWGQCRHHLHFDLEANSEVDQCGERLYYLNIITTRGIICLCATLIGWYLLLYTHNVYSIASKHFSCSTIGFLFPASVGLLLVACERLLLNLFVTTYKKVPLTVAYCQG